jgi:putative tryptophan/tyrosine transport system substrate-binding protein
MICKAAIASFLCLSLAASAQSPAPGKHRLAILGVASAATYQRQLDAFLDGMRALGYRDGHNIEVRQRWADGDATRLPQLAADLVAWRPDVIVTSGPGTAAAKKATSSIPIVMAASGDAVATGLVQSLSHPGGNITGSSFFFPEVNAKRLELLKEALPDVVRVGVLVNPQGVASDAALAAMRNTASARGMTLHVVEARAPSDIAPAIEAIAAAGGQALAVTDHTMFVAQADAIARAARERKLPSVGFLELAEAGGLLAYGAKFTDMWRRAATYVDKILKGAAPAALAIEQPTTFDLVVNLSAARELGVSLPRTLLARADVTGR